jgi:hypothetical protein
MTDALATSEPTIQADSPAPAEAAAGARALIERQLWVLGRLAEAGLNLALAIERQGTAERTAERTAEDAAQVVQGDVALAYGRVSRAVRLTVALQARTLQDLQALDEVAARRRDAARGAAARERKDHVQRIVERLIEAEAASEAEADRLADEAAERLDHDDIYGDLTARPAGEIIALVCRDLGLSPDWSRLAEEAWAQAEIAAGAAGSPFSALLAPRRLEPEEAPTAGAGPPGRRRPRAASP